MFKFPLGCRPTSLSNVSLFQGECLAAKLHLSFWVSVSDFHQLCTSHCTSERYQRSQAFGEPAFVQGRFHLELEKQDWSLLSSGSWAPTFKPHHSLFSPSVLSLEQLQVCSVSTQRCLYNTSRQHFSFKCHRAWASEDRTKSRIFLQCE